MPIKLTDTQRIILATAAARENLRVLPTQKSIAVNPSILTRSLKLLLKNNLISEVIAEQNDVAWEESNADHKITLVITDAGLISIGISSRAEEATKTSLQNQKHVVEGPRPGSKLAILADNLSKSNGATIEELIKATGWQAHSIRGAISGTLKKKFKLEVLSEKIGGRRRVYRIPPTEVGDTFKKNSK